MRPELHASTTDTGNVEIRGNGDVSLLSVSLGPEAAATLRDELTVAIGDPTPDKPFKGAADVSDIRKGDRICTKRSVEGVMHTCTGVAHEQVNGEWWTEQGGCLNTRDIRVRPFITILERPEIEWEPGDAALDRKGDPWQFYGKDGWTRIGGTTFYTTEDLLSSFGPIRRAKIVEADS